jgi:hypothetical protein
MTFEVMFRPICCDVIRFLFVKSRHYLYICNYNTIYEYE